VDANGDYTYREGYHKLLVDFKMFDADGNILPQENITPNLDDGFMKELLNAEIDEKQSYEFPQEVYDAIDEKFGQGTLHSDRDTGGNLLSTYAKIQEEQQKLYQRELDLIERKRVAENNPELLQAMDDYSELFTEMRSLIPKKHQGTATQAELDRIEEIKTLRDERLKRVSELQESIGLNALAKEAEEIQVKKELVFLPLLIRLHHYINIPKK
jgi:hypothetical protein